MAFYVVADKIVTYSPQGFLAHISFFSIFANFSGGVYDMRQFLFIPVPAGVYGLVCTGLRVHSKSQMALLYLMTLFGFNLINYAFSTPLMLHWNFGLYMLVFGLGYEFSQRNLLSHLRRWSIIVALAATAIVVLAVTLFVFVNWDTSTVVGRLNFYSFQWLENTAFGVSTIVLALLGLAQLRKNFFNAKIYGVINVWVRARCALLI
jgi:hypothetical protein